MTDLVLNDTVHGFTVTSREELAEIDGIAWVMHHAASGARLLFLQNDDENKAFSIAFKTPPGNDTGVFHILEHSVLCGSDRFPVKEPFVNLLKSSMQTFLNAMTFPDKTMYPVASTNEQDLLNLMDVYMDAVFHPAIYRNEAIFRQEGWHYELLDAEAGQAPQLIHNGVVFNEMKGALSSAPSVLFDVLQAALFPDTAYRFESGGTPQGIPELTYEMFLDEHRAHYRTDNSSIVLYGDMNIDRVLAFLDERYLTPLAAAAAIGEGEGDGNAPLAPRALELQAPVVAENVIREMETAPENACCALGYVVGTAADRERIYAADILLDALFGSNEAPLKRILLDADLGDDVTGTLADSMLQPFAEIMLKGAKPGALPQFQRTFERAVADLVENGIDQTLIEASIAHSEFVLREFDFGISDGVALAMSAMSGWLYGQDDSLACAYIRYEDVLSALRAKIGTSYFDDLARELFLECPHRATAEIKPIEAACPSAEEMHLAQVLKGMDETDIARVCAEAAGLRAAQEQPDSPEALAMLPKLTLGDIGPAKERPGYHLVEEAPFPFIRHEVGTRGLAYARRSYDARCVEFEEMPYLSILALLLGKLGTARHTAAELDTLIQARLGDIAFFEETRIPDAATARGTQDEVHPVFVVSASALGQRAQDLCEISAEIIHETDFSDTARIKAVLLQQRFFMEQQFSAAGHTAARRRASSYYLYEGVLAEALAGVDFYRFIKELLAHYDERAEALSAKLAQIARRIFVCDGLTLSFAGDSEAQTRYLAAMEPEMALARHADADASHPHKLIVPEPVKRNEAFIVPSDVTYAGQSFNLKFMDAYAHLPFNSVWNVVSRVLSFDFLWNEVRVKGGAYGVGFGANLKGELAFYSYRDPHIDATLERFAATPAWLERFDPSADEMDGYIVSTVSGFDVPLKPRALMIAQMQDYLAGRDPQWRAEARQQVINATPQAIRAFAAPVADALSHDAICVFGNKDIIEKSKHPFDIVDLLGA